VEEESARLQKIAQTFQDEADESDALTRRYQTRYDEMLDELISRVRVPAGARILDLGGGTGTLAEQLLDRMPGASITVLDASSRALAVAERKLHRFAPRVRFVERVFEDMPEGPFEAVVSTLALHHLGTDDEKKRQYARILAALTPGGCFWQGESVVNGSTEDAELDERRWVEWLRTQDFSEDEVQGLLERVHDNDRPAPLVDQLVWLRDLGFVRVDCTWRYLMYAVFGGWKESSG
jgi:tRNA (cmo5U34)-methyltransferase